MLNGIVYLKITIEISFLRWDNAKGNTCTFNKIIKCITKFGEWNSEYRIVFVNFSLIIMMMRTIISWKIVEKNEHKEGDLKVLNYKLERDMKRNVYE